MDYDFLFKVSGFILLICVLTLFFWGFVRGYNEEIPTPSEIFNEPVLGMMICITLVTTPLLWYQRRVQQTAMKKPVDPLAEPED